MTERSAFVLRVRPDKVEEYVRAHAEVWPEMLDALRGAGEFSAGEIETSVRAAAAALGVGAGALIHPLRLVVTGVSLGPGLFELMAVIGKDACLRRIDRGLAAFG